LPGSLQRRKSGQIFPKFSCRTHIKVARGDINN